MSSISSPPRLLPVLRTPGVAAFLGGRFLAAMGQWSERIAIGWLIWNTTQSPALVGLAAFLRLAPAIALSPLGGVLADRHGAVGILRIAHALNALLALALAATAAVLPLGLLLAATACLGVVQALAAAPLKSVVPQVLAREHLPVAIPLSSATFNLAGFVGPAVAGAAIALAGVWAALAVSAVGCIVFWVALGRWTNTDRRRAEGEEAEGIGREIAAALSYVRSDPVMRPIFLLHLAAALCLRPFIDLLPAFVGASGDSGAALLGLATSAVGAGAVVGALWMAVSAGATTLARRLLLATLVAVAALLALAITGFSVGILPLVLVFGTAMVVRATATLTFIQLVAPPAMRGRVAGFYSMTIRGGAAVGAAAIGVLGEAAGLDVAMGLAAALCAGCLALQWRHIRRPRDMSLPDDEQV